MDIRVGSPEWKEYCKKEFRAGCDRIAQIDCPGDRAIEIQHLWERVLLKQVPIGTIRDEIKRLVEEAALAINTDENPPIVENKKPVDCVVVEGVQKKLVTFEDVNKEFAILMPPNSASVYVSRADLHPITKDDLAMRLDDRVIQAGADKNGNPIYKSALIQWKGDKRRHLYRRIEFTNTPSSDGVFNLFKGFGVEPKEGDCSLIVQHVEEVLCSGSADMSESMLNLLSWQYQHVGEPSRIVPVLKTSRQQAGKGIFFEMVMLQIYGDSGFRATRVEQVLGRFNDALKGRVFILLDEVLFSGDIKSANAVKSLSTTTASGIEPKNMPVITCPLAVNLWLLSNYDNAAHIEEYDERYWVFNPSEHRINDTEYFDALVNQIKCGGVEAFAHLLKTRDVSNFVPWRDIKKDNDAKSEMIKLSVNPCDVRNWLEECCITETIVGCGTQNHGDSRLEGVWEPWCAQAVWSYAALSAAYNCWVKSVRSPKSPQPTPSNKLAGLLTHCGVATKTGTGGERLRVLPSTLACRRALWKPLMVKSRLVAAAKPTK